MYVNGCQSPVDSVCVTVLPKPRVDAGPDVSVCAANAPSPVDFDVQLESAEKWNYAVGIFHAFSPKAHLSLEYGFGDRTHTLFNFTYRF